MVFPKNSKPQFIMRGLLFTKNSGESKYTGEAHYQMGGRSCF